MKYRFAGKEKKLSIGVYAIATGRATVNPAAELTGTLKAPKTKHFPHLTAQELPELLQKLSEYTGSPILLDRRKWLL